MAKVEEKQPIVAEIAEQIKDAQSVVLVDYRGLTVEQDTNLRRQLRAAGITYKVYKNTMMNFAFKGTAFEGLTPFLEGPSAIAISNDDATAPARLLVKLTKEAPKLEMKAGIIEGVVYDAAGVIEIAKIPSREELISKLLGSLQSPITNFARVLNQIAEKGGPGNCEAAPAAEAEAAVAAEAEAAVATEAPEAPVAEEAPEAPAEAPVAEEAPATEAPAE
ncbi:MAG: 50S ribosomal protein L10 [Lachnospiraceae bacterium]|nr:50S ribosomal protein L10 [Lachnospiraceae bacterium]